MELLANIPSGPIEKKWDKHKFEMKLVNPANKRKYTVIMASLHIENTARRAVGYVLVTWVPLLALSALSLRSGGHELRLFLSDLPALVRFLVAAPILVLAETRIHRFTFQTARQFAAAGLVVPGERARYRAALDEVARGRESKLAEGIIVILSFVAAWIWFRNELRTGEAGWHGTSERFSLHQGSIERPWPFD